MDPQEATNKFFEADALFRSHDWPRALAILKQLDAAYPDEHRILYPMARCHAEMHDYEASLALCNRLVAELGYQRAERLRDKMMEKVAETGLFNEDLDMEQLAGDVSDEDERLPARRFRVRPIRWTALALCGVALWQRWIPVWVGAVIIIAVLGSGYAVSRLFRRLLEIPFKMKAQALRGADVEVHSVSPAQPPEVDVGDDEPRGVRAYYLIECTITPLAPKGSQRFRAWELGELMLADAKRRSKSLDDQDQCFSIAQSWVIEDGQALEDEGFKLDGARRVRFLVGLPLDVVECQFVYYSEAFGRVPLAPAHKPGWSPEEQQGIETRVLQTPGSPP